MALKHTKNNENAETFSTSIQGRTEKLKKGVARLRGWGILRKIKSFCEIGKAMS